MYKFSLWAESDASPATWNTPSRVRVGTPQLLQCESECAAQPSIQRDSVALHRKKRAHAKEVWKGNYYNGNLSGSFLQVKSSLSLVIRELWRERESLRSEALLLTITGSVQLGPELWYEKAESDCAELTWQTSLQKIFWRKSRGHKSSGKCWWRRGFFQGRFGVNMSCFLNIYSKW